MSLKSRLEILAQQGGSLDRGTSAYKRLVALFDEGTFVELDAYAGCGEDAAGVCTGYGMIGGGMAYAFSQGGAVGTVHAKKVAKVYELAAKVGVPVVGIYDSVGARLEEGHDALAAYGQMLGCAQSLSGVVPQVAVVAGVCAGTAAVMAASADVVIMAKDAQLFMTAPFVTSALGDKVAGAGSAENAAKAGVCHLVAGDADDAVEQAKKIVSLLPLNNLSEAPYVEYEEADGTALRAICENMQDYDVAAVLAGIFDAGSVVELSAQFASHVTTALATLAGQVVGVVATAGAAYQMCSSCTAKIARFVSVCDSFGIPVITLVDTDGFYESASDELAGAARSAARLAHVYAEATCPKLTVVTGKACGSAYVVLAGKNASADLTLAWPSAVISTLSPEAAVNILWADKVKGSDKDAQAALVQEYIDTLASPFEAAKNGYVDDVIDPAYTRSALISACEMLAGKRVTNLPKKHGNMPF